MDTHRNHGTGGRFEDLRFSVNSEAKSTWTGTLAIGATVSNDTIPLSVFSCVI